MIFLISFILFFQLFKYFELNGNHIGFRSKIILFSIFFIPFVTVFLYFIRFGKLGANKKREYIFILSLYSGIAVFYIFTQVGLWKSVTNLVGLTKQNVIVKLSSEQYKFAELSIQKLNLDKKICVNKMSK